MHGSWRFCVDFRKLNAVTHRDAYPLLRIDSTLDTLKGSTLFTTLDLTSGYWQVEVKEEDKALSTPQGHFQDAFWTHQCTCYISAPDGVHLGRPRG